MGTHRAGTNSPSRQTPTPGTGRGHRGLKQATTVVRQDEATDANILGDQRPPPVQARSVGHPGDPRRQKQPMRTRTCQQVVLPRQTHRSHPGGPWRRLTAISGETVRQGPWNQSGRRAVQGLRAVHNRQLNRHGWINRSSITGAAAPAARRPPASGACRRQPQTP